MRPIPEALCLGLIHQFEGSGGTYEQTRTQDPVGNWEIGWSHKLAGESDPLWGATLDGPTADALALSDLNGAAQGLCNVMGGTIIASLTDGQYAALIDFVYNEGIDNFKSSTLERCLLAGWKQDIPAQLQRWIFGTVDGEKVALNGLIRRRNAEVVLWNA